jgi:hypothetical protein
MANKRITIQIKGDPYDNDKLRLYDFISQLEAIRSGLIRLEGEIAEPGSLPIQYEVADLTHQSPATVAVELIPPEKGMDVTALVADRFVERIKHIKAGVFEENIASEMLEPYRRIGPSVQRIHKKQKEPLKQRLSLVSIATESDKVDITEPLEPEIEKFVGPDELEYGSVSGDLELINIHANVNTFRIYPIVGAKKIDCHFKKTDLQKAISGIGKYVEVHGELRSKQRDRFPYAINATEIEVFPEENELPSILDLKGIAPQATGDLASEEFVRRLRHADW